jgi:hypothetical protein
MSPVISALFMGTVAAGGGLDSSTTAWISAVNSHGGTVSPGRQTTVNNLITTLKSGGVWSNWDRIWLHAAENVGSALTDLVAGALATAHNGGALTFTADRGYQDATNTASYIDSNFNPATAPSPHFVTDNACLFGWTNTAGIDLGALVGQGPPASGYSRIVFNYSDGLTRFDVTSSDLAGGTVVGALGVTGLYLANRRAGTGSQSMDVNGVNQGANSIASAAVPSVNLTGLTGAAASTSQLCAFGFGSGLTGALRVAFYNALRTYMTAVGVP